MFRRQRNGLDRERKIFCGSVHIISFFRYLIHPPCDLDLPPVGSSSTSPPNHPTNSMSGTRSTRAQIQSNAQTRSIWTVGELSCSILLDSTIRTRVNPKSLGLSRLNSRNSVFIHAKSGFITQPIPQIPKRPNSPWNHLHSPNI